MYDFNQDSLFLTAETHLAARAAKGRVEAINACPHLCWLVKIEDGSEQLVLSFDTAPTYEAITTAARARGVWVRFVIGSVTVGRKRQRPLLLMPWQRARTNHEH